VRQWVVVFPKRLRYFLNVDAGCLNGVAGIAMSEVQRAIAGASTSTAKAARSGGVLFVHRFGATLNAHVHLHLCMLDGVVAQGRQGLAFRGAQVDEACVERVQALVRQRVLGLFERRRLLSRAALYGHRPEQQQQRSIELRLSASEFLDRVAALIPPPRKHRHRYFGGLVPNSPWRAQVVAQAGRKPGAGSKAPRPKTVLTDFGATRAVHPARSPPLEMKSGQEPAAPETVFEAIPDLEFDQTERLTAEAGHDRLLRNAGVDAEPIPELEFDQTLGWKSCAVEIAHAAERGRAGFRRWLGAVISVGCQIRIVGSVQFPPGTRIKSLLTPLKSGL